MGYFVRMKIPTINVPSIHSIDLTKFDVKKFDVKKFDVKKFDVKKFDVKKFDAIAEHRRRENRFCTRRAARKRRWVHSSWFWRTGVPEGSGSSSRDCGERDIDGEADFEGPLQHREVTRPAPIALALVVIF